MDKSEEQKTDFPLLIEKNDQKNNKIGLVSYSCAALSLPFLGDKKYRMLILFLYYLLFFSFGFSATKHKTRT